MCHNQFTLLVGVWLIYFAGVEVLMAMPIYAFECLGGVWGPSKRGRLSL